MMCLTHLCENKVSFTLRTVDVIQDIEVIDVRLTCALECVPLITLHHVTYSIMAAAAPDNKSTVCMYITGYLFTDIS